MEIKRPHLAQLKLTPWTSTKKKLLRDPRDHPEDIKLHGFLYKQGARVKNWQQRWFILTLEQLFYFKVTDPGVVQSLQIAPQSISQFTHPNHEKSQHHFSKEISPLSVAALRPLISNSAIQLKGSISLSGCSVVAGSSFSENSEKDSSRSPAVSSPYAINIICPSRRLNLVASSQTDVELWVQAIRFSIRASNTRDQNEESVSATKKHCPGCQQSFATTSAMTRKNCGICELMFCGNCAQQLLPITIHRSARIPIGENETTQSTSKSKIRPAPAFARTLRSGIGRVVNTRSSFSESNASDSVIVLACNVCCELKKGAESATKAYNKYNDSSTHSNANNTQEYDTGSSSSDSDTELYGSCDVEKWLDEINAEGCETETQSKRHRKGWISALVRKLGSTDDAVRRVGLRSLANALNSFKHRQLFAAEEGIPILVRILQTGDLQCQRLSLIALRLLTRGDEKRASILNPSTNPSLVLHKPSVVLSTGDIQSLIISSGAIPSLLRLINLESDADCQIYAAATLRNMSTRIENLPAIVDESSVQRLLHALKTDRPGLLREITATLCCLCRHPLARAAFLTENGVHEITGLLKNDEDQVCPLWKWQVREHICGIVANMMVGEWEEIEEAYSSIASAKLHVTFVGLLYEATKVNESEEFVNLNQNTDLVLPCKLSNRIVSFCIAACTALRNLTTKFDIQREILLEYNDFGLLLLRLLHSLVENEPVAALKLNSNQSQPNITIPALNIVHILHQMSAHLILHFCEESKFTESLVSHGYIRTIAQHLVDELRSCRVDIMADNPRALDKLNWNLCSSLAGIIWAMSSFSSTAKVTLAGTQVVDCLITLIKLTDYTRSSENGCENGVQQETQVQIDELSCKRNSIIALWVLAEHVWIHHILREESKIETIAKLLNDNDEIVATSAAGTLSNLAVNDSVAPVIVNSSAWPNLLNHIIKTNEPIEDDIYLEPTRFSMKVSSERDVSFSSQPSSHISGRFSSPSNASILSVQSSSSGSTNKSRVQRAHASAKRAWLRLHTYSSLMTAGIHKAIPHSVNKSKVRRSSAITIIEDEPNETLTSTSEMTSKSQGEITHPHKRKDAVFVLESLILVRGAALKIPENNGIVSKESLRKWLEECENPNADSELRSTAQRCLALL